MTSTTEIVSGTQRNTKKARAVPGLGHAGVAKPKSARKAAEPKPKRSGRDGATGARDDTKAARILNLLKRGNGATLSELMEATDWQAHSVRGFLSGTIRKKMGLEVLSAKGQDGKRSYSVKG